MNYNNLFSNHHSFTLIKNLKKPQLINSSHQKILSLCVLKTPPHCLKTPLSNPLLLVKPPKAPFYIIDGFLRGHVIKVKLDGSIIFKRG